MHISPGRNPQYSAKAFRCSPGNRFFWRKRSKTMRIAAWYVLCIEALADDREAGMVSEGATAARNLTLGMVRYAWKTDFSTLC